MVERDDRRARCYACVRELSEREGWGLSDRRIDAYVELLVRLVPPAVLATRLEQAAMTVHADYDLYTALRDSLSAEHAAAWDWVQREITRAAQFNGLSWSSDPAVDLSDLVQTVHGEVVRSIGDYRFQSRLRTWLHSVTIRRLRRFHRDTLAAKRAVRPEPLEAAAEQPVVWDEIEQQVLASVLAADIRRVLDASGDERYAHTFLLRFLAGRSAEEIGERLKLHPSRVRTLIKVARDLLSQDPTIRAWLPEELPDDDDENARKTI